MMKKRTVLLVIVGVVVVLGLIATAIMLCNQPRRTGNFVQNPDAYLMNFEVLQGKFSHTMDLQEGDVLAVHLERNKGNFDVNIALQTLVGDNIEVLSSIYTGNDVTGGDFELPIETGGIYKITVTGRHAGGVANFVVKHGN